jgi:hypothetical protein
MFEKVYIVKPRASRKGSAEVYVVAKNLRKDRILPKEFGTDGKLSQIIEEDDTEPLPGDNLPDYGEPEEYGKKGPS